MLSQELRSSPDQFGVPRYRSDRPDPTKRNGYLPVSSMSEVSFFVMTSKSGITPLPVGCETGNDIIQGVAFRALREKE